MNLKNTKTSPTMRGHQPSKDVLPCGDYYGTGFKNPVGKMRGSSLFGSSDISPKSSKRKKLRPLKIS